MEQSEEASGHDVGEDEDGESSEEASGHDVSEGEDGESSEHANDDDDASNGPKSHLGVPMVHLIYVQTT